MALAIPITAALASSAATQLTGTPEATSKLRPQDTPWRPKAERCDLLVLPVSASGKLWHWPPHARDSPRDGKPRQQHSEHRLPSHGPGAAPFQSAGAEGQQHSTHAGVKTQDTRVGSTFRLGGQL